MTETAVQEQITTAITNIGPADVEVDTSYENDSTYGDELSSYSASLTSSVLEYRHENGRRYHKYRDGAYLLPNDESENDRLDMVHEMFLLLLHGKLYLAPIKNPQRVMDLATGTGLWAIDFADQHPPAEVIGCDLSSIQPTLVPPNLKFLVDDLTSDWEYESNPFDFIHARYLCFSFKDIGKLVKQCYRSVKPGGWVEFQDWDAYPISQDGSLSGTDLEKYYNEVYGAFEKTGVEVRPGIKLEQWFKDAGFVNIQVEKFVIPYGVWPKDARLKKVGAWAQIQAEASGYESVAMAVLTRFENWKKEEVQILANKASADARRRDIHMMFNFYVVYGQRPEK